MLEERVILIKESNINKAILKASVEASKYAKYTYINKFGKKVTSKFIGFIDAYEILDKLENGAELYSATQVIADLSKLKRAVRVAMGAKETLLHKKMREHFQHY